MSNRLVFNSPSDHYAQVLAVLWSHDRIRLAQDNKGTGSPDHSIVELNKATALVPENAWPHRALGNIDQAIGNKDKAVSMFESASRIEPEDRLAQKALGRPGCSSQE